MRGRVVRASAGGPFSLGHANRRQALLRLLAPGERMNPPEASCCSSAPAIWTARRFFRPLAEAASDREQRRQVQEALEAAS